VYMNLYDRFIPYNFVGSKFHCPFVLRHPYQIISDYHIIMDLLWFVITIQWIIIWYDNHRTWIRLFFPSTMICLDSCPYWIGTGSLSQPGLDALGPFFAHGNLSAFPA
jgi:hypothetical protein